jgi:hypothetical protein
MKLQDQHPTSTEQSDNSLFRLAGQVSIFIGTHWQIDLQGTQADKPRRHQLEPWLQPAALIQCVNTTKHAITEHQDLTLPPPLQGHATGEEADCR